MSFDPQAYGTLVSEILALDGHGLRPMPLVAGVCSSREAAARLRAVDPSKEWKRARSPKAALAGLWAYYSDFDEAHNIAQELKNGEGSYWHGILHRMEPDSATSYSRPPVWL